MPHPSAAQLPLPCIRHHICLQPLQSANDGSSPAAMWMWLAECECYECKLRLSHAIRHRP
eukprot:scaffold157767_cov17-Tisochrysis_lutea.AAC.1